MTIFIQAIPLQLYGHSLLTNEYRLAHSTQQGFGIMPSYRMYCKFHVISLISATVTLQNDKILTVILQSSQLGNQAKISPAVPAGTSSNNSSRSALRIRTQPCEPGLPNTVLSGVP